MNTILSATQNSGSYYDRYTIGLTNVSFYYPIYLFFDGEFSAHLTEEVEGVEDTYVFYKLKHYADISFTYANVLRLLKSSGILRTMKMIKDGERINFKVAKGAIFDEHDNIKMLLCKKNIKMLADSSKCPKEDLILFISHDFMTLEKYRLLYKRVEKEYISYFYENGIDIQIKTSEKIEKEVFKTGFELKGDTLSEMRNTLDNFILSEREESLLSEEEESPLVPGVGLWEQIQQAPTLEYRPPSYTREHFSELLRQNEGVWERANSVRAFNVEEGRTMDTPRDSFRFPTFSDVIGPTGSMGSIGDPGRRGEDAPAEQEELQRFFESLTSSEQIEEDLTDEESEEEQEWGFEEDNFEF